MIRLDFDDGQKWTAWVVNEFGHKVSLNLSPFRALGSDGRRFVELLARGLEGKQPNSQKSQLSKITSEIGGAVRVFKMSGLPRSESDWQDLVIRLYEFTLGRTDTSRTLANRVKDWNSNLAPNLEMLRDAHDLIPLGVEIPRARVSEEAIAHARERTKLLGQPKATSAPTTIDKTLASISIGRTDAEYLDEIRDSLSEKRRVLKQFLLEWWKQIKEHYEYGEKLNQGTDLDKLLVQLRTIQSSGSVHKGMRAKSSITNGRTETSLGNLLALFHHFHGSICRHSSLRKATLYFPCHASVWLPASAPQPVSEQVGIFDRINWMLGSLSAFDVAVCTALVTMGNPSFTPYSLIFAKITDKNGRPHLELNNSGHFFRIEKRRAKVMKDPQLAEVSHEIISTIIDMTSRYRSEVKKDNPAEGNLLFLCWRCKLQTHGAPEPNQLHRKLVGSRDAGKDNIYSYFPELETVLPRGTISLSRIRATEGVLEWFRSGSLQRMSRKLGNTQRVVLNHYIPKPLLVAWNTRLIRRFQNLWLAIAAADEDFLLSVTDFHTLEDLHLFLADMLEQHSPNSSPLGKELHARFSIAASHEGDKHRNSSNLMVSVSPRTLTYLYLYQETILDAGIGAVELDHRDPVSGLSPRFFLDLAELLRHQLPSNRDPELRESHEAAESRVAELIHDIQWTDLLLKRGRLHHEE